jgi:hypothetical protein
MKDDADTHRNAAFGRSEITCSQHSGHLLAQAASLNEFDDLTAGLNATGRAEWVSMLQTALGVKNDGIFGPVTQRALSDYKIAASLRVPVSQRLRTACHDTHDLASKIIVLAEQLHVGSQGDHVRALQRSLGLDDHGMFDSVTQSALADFNMASRAPENLGALVQYMDSGHRSVFTISSRAPECAAGYYGVHQLSSASGTMAAFVASPENAAFSPHFAGLMPASTAFNEAYSAVATNDPAGFAQAQRNYITRMHYVPVLRYALNLGFTVSDRGVQEALYSQSVQYGRQENLIMLDQIVTTERNMTSVSAAQQIEMLYAARSVCFYRFADREKYAQEVQHALRISRYFQQFFKLD